MSQEENEMLDYIENRMILETWKDISSELARDTIKALMDKGLINNVEFNSSYSKIRKIDLSGYGKNKIDRGWYDKK